MIQVCLNGLRSKEAHPSVPHTAQELAEAARSAVAAGAEEIHLHPKDHTGHDTLDPETVAAALTHVRAAVPGVPIGVTTGAWIEPDPGKRSALIRSWDVLPDYASVNWHEDGAESVAAALLERGVGIEAGIFSGTNAAQTFTASSLAPKALRILAEVIDPDPRTSSATAADLLRALEDAQALRILLHGEDAGAWPVLRMALSLGLDCRIGLEDVLTQPDGTAAADNAALIAIAREMQMRLVSPATRQGNNRTYRTTLTGEPR